MEEFQKLIPQLRGFKSAPPTDSPVIPQRISVISGANTTAASGMKARIQSRMKLLNIAPISVTKEDQPDKMPDEAIYNSYLANCPDHWEEVGV